MGGSLIQTALPGSSATYALHAYDNPVLNTAIIAEVNPLKAHGPRSGMAHRLFLNWCIRKKSYAMCIQKEIEDALASVRDYSSRIILIDGNTLADYMIDHGVGVSVASTYEIKKVDSVFFEEGIE
jgi:hypothetical protein